MYVQLIIKNTVKSSIRLNWAVVDKLKCSTLPTSQVQGQLRAEWEYRRNTIAMIWSDGYTPWDRKQ